MLAHKRSAQRRYVADGRPPSRAQIGIFSASSSSRRHELIIAPIRQGACHEAHPTRYSRSRCVSDHRDGREWRQSSCSGADRPGSGHRRGRQVRRPEYEQPSHTTARGPGGARLPTEFAGQDAVGLASLLPWRGDILSSPRSAAARGSHHALNEGAECGPGKTLTRQSSGPLKQDRLQESDIPAPRIGQDGPTQAHMVARQITDLRLLVPRRGRGSASARWHGLAVGRAPRLAGWSWVLGSAWRAWGDGQSPRACQPRTRQPPHAASPQQEGGTPRG